MKLSPKLIADTAGKFYTIQFGNMNPAMSVQAEIPQPKTYKFTLSMIRKYFVEI